MRTVTVTEAARNFSDLVSRVHHRRESALLVKGGRPMVRIELAQERLTGRELAALWPSIRHLRPGEAERFARDLDAARAAPPRLRSKWD
jgi:antitoxin (DNA-binding transcriptional repressor) of toxin-antitoxin stability system